MKAMIGKDALNSLLNTKVEEVNSKGTAIKEEFISSRKLPVVYKAGQAGMILSEWIKSNQQKIEGDLNKYAGVLFRNFQVSTLADFQQTVQAFSNNLLPYTQRSSPRTELENKVYTSTDHPADQVINMHNELSYAHQWPLRIMFCCLIPADQGGETPITDSRSVYRDLSESTRDKFERRGIMYQRNLRREMGLPWEEVFQTHDRAEVEKECEQKGIQYEWKGDHDLQMRWYQPAIQHHPRTGEKVWFNHAFFFNARHLEGMLEGVMTYDDIPFNTFYGDGSPIEKEVMSELEEVYDNNKIIFPWRKGDVLLLDNMMAAHGRNPFKGKRKVVVAFWEEHSVSLNLQPSC